MSDTIKVLTAGSAFGSIVSLFEKVSAIDKKHGKFSVLLCTGDFFGGAATPTGSPDEVALLLDGKIAVPMTTYITQGIHELPPRVIARVAETGGEICPNVIFLGKSGVMNVDNKIKVGCIGGVLDIEKFTQTTEDNSPFINQATIKSFQSHPLLAAPKEDSLASAKAGPTSPFIDIMISHLWPPSIPRLSNTISGLLSSDGKQLDALTWSAPPLDGLIQQYKPRYHFASAAPFFWEREPFMWDGDDDRVARFVNLGAFGGESLAGTKKPRWFYAFSIAPANSSPAQTRPPNATPSPFYISQKPTKRGAEADEVSSTASFMWGANSQRPDHNKRPRTDAPQGGSQKPLPAGYKCKHCSEENAHWASDCQNKPEDRPPPGYKCNKCGSAEHYVRQCTQIPEGYVCRKCNGTDHFVRDCKAINTSKRPPDTYSCRACGSSEHYFKDCPEAGPRQAPLKEIGPDECWFCLSNPKVTKHLIVSIGSECYLTLTKGQLIPTGPSSSTESTPVPGGGHLLIVPISHYPTLLSVPPDLAISIISEVERYKSALRALFAQYNASAVVFEVARLSGRGGHAHIQVIPVPNALAERVEGMFRSRAEMEGIRWESDPEAALEGARRGDGNYFRVDLPDGRKMISLIRGSFNLQFGRTTIAELLGLGDRADWKACPEDDAQQRADAAKFKKAFASFDPANEA